MSNFTNWAKAELERAGLFKPDSDYDGMLGPAMPNTELKPLRFYLHRDEDESGVSGTGLVAHGVEFPDGTVVLHWCVPGVPSGTTIYTNIHAVRKVHGHNGKTQVVWLD